MVAAPVKKERAVGAAPKLDVKVKTGAARKVTLDPQVFSLTPNVPVMHQVVNAQLAARRAGTQSTKTRADVSGGGAKPYRQKGTGRARQGSTRAPQFTGGGVALGPKPRSYEQHTPKKMVQLALRSALSDRASDGKVVVTSGFDFSPPKTKDAVAALESWGIEGSALVVLDDSGEDTYLAFRNLGNVHIVHQNELNPYDVLRHDYVVFTEDTLPGEKPEKTAVGAPSRKKAPAVVESTEVESDSNTHSEAASDAETTEEAE